MKQEQKDVWYDKRIADAIGSDLNMQLVNKEDELNEIEEKTQYLQLQYSLLTLLETNSNKIKDETPVLVYEKYFQLRQGELARIEGIGNMAEEWKTGYLDSYYKWPAVLIDDNLYVQYANTYEIREYELPRNILITGSDIELGFMGARAGMNFQEIQENAYEKEIQEGFMYDEDLTVYYIEFTDDFYDYIYYSDYPDGKNSWLIIS
ncbi:MAG: hypothetical protein NC489_22515 [Ruminococcus flavefaciens]|nr:hypothetical protein [Ruminococcus flavefaciens]